MDRQTSADATRRRFISLLGGATVLIGVATRGLRAQAPAASAGPQSKASSQRVSESDPLAQSLGYKDNAAQVDKSKFSTYKAGEKCSACRFFQGPARQPYGPCQIFSGKLVNADGWCSSFNAK